MFWIFFSERWQSTLFRIFSNFIDSDCSDLIDCGCTNLIDSDYSELIDSDCSDHISCDCTNFIDSDSASVVDSDCFHVGEKRKAPTTDQASCFFPLRKGLSGILNFLL